jgi:uncharacterized membrane protein
MGWKSWLLGTPISETAKSIGNLSASIRSALTGELKPEQRVKLEENLIALQDKMNEAQSTINEVEAKSTSLFIAGWRPAVGWTCVFGLWTQVFVFPILKIWHDVPPFDSEILMGLLIPLLGLGAYRTYEKKVGVQDKH